MFSLQTKRAIYLTKTPFQLKCKLHDHLMPFLHDSLTLGDRSRVRCFKRRNIFKNFVFLCFAVKQKFYGHLLATRIFHLATEKKFQSQLDAHIKKLISDPLSLSHNQ